MSAILALSIAAVVLAVAGVVLAVVAIATLPPRRRARERHSLLASRAALKRDHAGLKLGHQDGDTADQLAIRDRPGVVMRGEQAKDLPETRAVRSELVREFAEAVAGFRHESSSRVEVPEAVTSGSAPTLEGTPDTAYLSGAVSGDSLPPRFCPAHMPHGSLERCASCATQRKDRDAALTHRRKLQRGRYLTLPANGSEPLQGRLEAPSDRFARPGAGDGRHGARESGDRPREIPITRRDACLRRLDSNVESIRRVDLRRLVRLDRFLIQCADLLIRHVAKNTARGAR